MTRNPDPPHLRPPYFLARALGSRPCSRITKHINKNQSIQTDGSEPNKLLVAEMTVFRARVAAADAVAASADGRTAIGGSSASAAALGSSLHTTKAILHPGEVNKIREIVQNPAVVVTHSDDPRLFAWNTDRQPDRAGESGGPSASPSTPDLVLGGHTDVAEFALATSSAAPFVASGGRDERVLVWSLADAEVISAATTATKASPSSANKELKPRSTFVGHSAAVEDVCFRPESSDLLASVGDDGALLLWDSRIGGATGGGGGGG